MSEKDISNIEVPPEFYKIMKDFLNDILITFPEYESNITEEENLILANDTSNNKLYLYCCSVYPERFFDILYKNYDMFENDEINTFFLPNIDFKIFFKEDISENTKGTLWKYLQLILFTISNTISDSNSFGDTAKLFEAIDEDELKNKMQESMNEMMNMFDLSNNDLSGVNFNNIDLSNNAFNGIDLSGIDMPNPKELNDHINTLLNGKLGHLAGEIAQETADELNIDVNNTKNVSDVFEKLFKNPGRLINMVKKVGKKLEEKLQSGEIKESELMEEASELMEKMKTMPGMKNMESIFSKMGMPTNKNSKVNLNAMQSNLQRNIKLSKQKERMRAKLQKRQEKRQEKFKHNTFNPNSEKIQKSFINKSNEEPVVTKKRKKRKKKKKKKDQ